MNAFSRNISLTRNALCILAGNAFAHTAMHHHTMTTSHHMTSAVAALYS